MLFSKRIKEHENYYVIPRFPFRAFWLALKRQYKTTKIAHLITAIGIGGWSRRPNASSVRIHKFFIPELVYLLKKFSFPEKLINRIIQDTYISSTFEPPATTRLDMKRISKQMTHTLYPYQQEFIETYDMERQRYDLNGYVLSFEQGLGKTITSLSLMCGLGLKKVIIVAPKSTLKTVWVDHITRFYKQPQRVCLIGEEEFDLSADFFVVNYAALPKLLAQVSRLTPYSDSLGIIVDESHNFLRSRSNRTKTLIALRQALDCHDILLMSGTPIKAIGVEMISLLMILDRYFDTDAQECFKKALGINTTLATDILKARLSTMMHRELKENVLTLPDKREHTIKIKTPGGQKYTILKVQEQVVAFVEERMAYHNDKMDQYVRDFYLAIEYIKEHRKDLVDGDFHQYLDHIKWLRKHPIQGLDPQSSALIQWVNTYEKDVIIPNLPKELKQKFKDSRSAVKYVHLKIRGEVIGMLLMRLRIEMTSSMIEHAKLVNMVNAGVKKTVIFTSYVDTIEATGKYLTSNGFSPLLIYGKTSGNTTGIVAKFMKDNDANPLVASIKTIGTGVTLTAAAQMIFLNKPWRHSDYAQCSDRIHRIGQDTPVDIYTLILDTGDLPNLSTRMEEVMAWSKDMFDAIVGDATLKDPDMLRMESSFRL